MPPEYDLFAVTRGTITAPAGCGKTQLIADTISLHKEIKPILVLTHTNAGVSSLRIRLQRNGVPNSAYRLATIDGFAMRLVGRFPVRSGLNPEVLELKTPRTDYPNIREAAWRLLQAGHLSDALSATYSRLIVDEYQDCSLTQHAIVDWAAEVLPTCILGDPMQAIFGFRGNVLVDWNTNVLQQFPAIGELLTPWRWRNAGTEALGDWLLNCRHTLAAGGSIDLHTAPQEVNWIPLTLRSADQQRMEAARTRTNTRDGSVLVIGDSMNVQGRHRMASHTPGATNVESVDLKDLTDFGQSFEVSAEDSLVRLVTFAGNVMTNVGATELLRRVSSIQRGTARNPPTPTEAAVVAFANAPSLTSALNALTAIKEQPNVRAYRPEILRCCMVAIQAASDGSCTLHNATIREREKNRYMSRPIARRSVGSTLLLKGLEAEVAVLLQPETMDAKHLYVALTRGSQRVVICSETGILTPTR